MNDETDKSLVSKENFNTTSPDNEILDNDIKNFTKRVGELARIEEKKVKIEERKVEKYYEIQVRQIASENELEKLKIQNECEHNKRKDENERLKINANTENENNNRKLILQLVLIGVSLVLLIILSIISFLFYLVYSGKDAIAEKVFTTIVNVLGGGGIAAGIIALISTAIRVIKNKGARNLEENKDQSTNK